MKDFKTTMFLVIRSNFVFVNPFPLRDFFADFASMSRANFFLKRVVQDVRHKTSILCVQCISYVTG